MQNIKAVRKLLLNPSDIAYEQQQAVLDSVFDYLVEEGRGTPERKIKSLMFDLVWAKRADNLSTSSRQLHLLSPEVAANVVRAVAYCFWDEFQLIPEIVLVEFRVYDSAPTIYKEEAGVHAMIMITLLDLADDNEAFNGSDSKFDEHLMTLLIEGLQKRYFRNSRIYSHQSSLLSSVLKKFVGRAYGMLPLSKYRWNSLCHIIAMSEPFFSGGDENKPGDASLEYALLNEFCFKLFNTC